MCLVSSVSWATFESLVGKPALARKTDKSVYGFFSSNQMRCLRKPMGWICTGENNWCGMLEIPSFSVCLHLCGGTNSNSKRIKDFKLLSETKGSEAVHKHFKAEKRKINETLILKWSLHRTAASSCNLTWTLHGCLLNSLESRPLGTAQLV